MNWLKTLALIVTMLVFFVLALAAMVGNHQELPLRFASLETPVSLSVFWWLMLAFLLGLALGLLNGAWFNMKRRLENRSLRKELTQARAQVSEGPLETERRGVE